MKIGILSRICLFSVVAVWIGVSNGIHDGAATGLRVQAAQAGESAIVSQVKSGSAADKKGAADAATPALPFPAGARPLVQEAERLFSARRLAEAERKYQEALVFDENNVFLLSNLAACQLEQNRLAEAEASLQRALAQKPDAAQALSLSGILKFRQSKYDEALKWLERASEIDPKNPETLNYLGITLYQKGQVGPGEAALRRAIKLAPGYAGARHNVAVIYAMEKPPFAEQARYEYLKALSLGHRKNGALEKILDSHFVGELGQPDRLHFEGLKTFTAQAIKSSLTMNLDFQLAAHPDAPRGAYLELIRELVINGYRRKGFPEASAAVRLDSKAGIVVRVNEGPRYRCGDVRVLGARTFPVDELKKVLTQAAATLDSAARQSARFTESPANWLQSGVSGIAPLEASGEQLTNAFHNLTAQMRPVWDSGKPAPFDAGSLLALTDTVTNVFSAQGYFLYDVRVKVAPVPEDGTAELLVEIVDEGVKGRIDEIEITGNQRNSREVLLSYLGVNHGMAIERDLSERIYSRLWLSGRFLKHEIAIDPVDRAGKMRLTLSLIEAPEVPTLDQTLSPKGKALLRLRDWLSNWRFSGEDAVISYKGNPDSKLNPSQPAFQILNDWIQSDVILIVSQSGLALVVREAHPSGEGKLRYAAVVSPQIAALYSPGRRQKLVFDRPDLDLNAFFTWEPDKEPSPTNQFHLAIGASFQTRKDETNGPPSAPVAIDITLAPVAFTDWAYRAVSDPNERITLEGDVLTIERIDPQSEGGMRIKADAVSGRLLGLDVSVAQDDFKAAGKVHFEPGAFSRQVKALEEATVSYGDAYDAQSPFGSMVSFFVREALQSEAIRKLLTEHLFEKVPPDTLLRAASAVEKIWSKKILSPFDRLTAKAENNADEPFDAVWDYAKIRDAGESSMFALAAAATVRFADELFPARSWPWTLTREWAFVMGGRPRYTELELEKIQQSDECGPLACLAGVKILGLMKSPASGAFARRGLARLSVNDFRKDYSFILGGNSILAECAVKAAAALKELTNEEVETLAGILPQEDGDFVRRCARLLRERQGQPLVEVLSPALDEYWQRRLKTHAEAVLRQAVLEAIGFAIASDPSQAVRRSFSNSGIPESFAEASQTYRAMADRGDADAEYRLTAMYQKGLGVTADALEALEWHRRAAEHGLAEAQVGLAWRYKRGLGVPQDYAASAEWYRKAAEQGHAGAMNDAAWLWATCPQAEVRNARKAIEYATRACKLDGWNNAEHLDTLAAAYAEAGEFKEAIKWQEKALDLAGRVSKQVPEGFRSRLRLYQEGMPYREK